MTAIEQIEPRLQQREQMAGSQAIYWRPPFISAIRWGSIIAGVAVSMSTQLLLALLGIATGLSILDNTEGNVVGYASLIWAGISMLVSAFAGGYVAARMSGMKRKMDGILHGAVLWAVSTLLFATMATSLGGALLNSVLTSSGPETAQSAQNSDASVTALLRGQLGGDVSIEDFQTLRRYIQAGERDEAILLLISMGMEPMRAVAIVDQAITVANGSERNLTQGARGANWGSENAGSAAWIVFFGIFLSLLLGMTGGVIGAQGARRAIWIKEDKPVSGKDVDSNADSTAT